MAGHTLRRGFTLIELLVVIAIIAVLMALLVPAVQKVREEANRMFCRNNLKQLGLALHQHHGEWGGFPAARQVTPRIHSWVPHILPYIELEAVHKRYDFTTNWNDPTTNDRLPNGVNQTEIKVLLCPSAPPSRRGARGRGMTDYAPTTQITRPNPFLRPIPRSDPTYIGVLGNDVRRQIPHVYDGTSNTTLLAEQAGLNQRWEMGLMVAPSGGTGAWANPGNQVVISGFNPAIPGPPGRCAVNCTNIDEIYAFHPAGANVLFTDGSVQLFRDKLDINIVVPLMTRARGEVVSLSDAF